MGAGAVNTSNFARRISRMSRAKTILRAAGGLWLGAGLTLQAAAALWVDPNWALIGDLRTMVAYDSNLTSRADGGDDYYGSLTPKLTLSRRGSSTRLDIDVAVERTWFRDFTEFNSTDPQANLVYEFPSAPGDEPTTHLDLHVGRDSSTNTDLGRRVRSDRARGQFDQRVWNTGRTALDLRLTGSATDFREDDLNTNEAFAIEARVGYAIAPQTRIGVGYGHEWTRSKGAGGRGDTDGSEDRVIVRANGELMPKLRGSIETGVAFVDYEGVVNRDDTAWIAAVSLNWDASPTTVATIRASRYTDFSPEGDTALRSELMMDLRHQGSGGLILRAGGGVRRLESTIGTTETQADAVILMVGIGYQLTERFSAELSDRWTQQWADRETFDYDRHFVTGEVHFLF
jgi:hypothetical protein